MNRITSSGLDMPAYPAGTFASDDLGEHIMGVVVIAWLTRYPLERWGPEWVRRGRIDVRFRAHLTAGRSLSVGLEPSGSRLGLAVRDEDDIQVAEGWAEIDHARTPAEAIGQVEQRAPAAPTREALSGLVLSPIRFKFDAARDLAFASSLGDRALWSQNGWAHPAWLGSAANALVRTNIDFERGGHWVHAGLRVDLRAPIRDGALIELGGRVDELFDRRRHRFASCALEAAVGGRPVASMRTTFAYAKTSS